MKNLDLKGEPMNIRKAIPFCFILSLFFILSTQSLVEAAIQVDVRTILASQKDNSIDSRLKGLVNELQTVFKYSSYKLLSQDRLNLETKTPGSVSLPGNRVLKITPKGISGNRMRLQVEISQDNRQIFQTFIQLQNGSSITIGGPKYKGGNLLFNIYTSF
jgi:hypothetical protein